MTTPVLNLNGRFYLLQHIPPLSRVLCASKDPPLKEMIFAFLLLLLHLLPHNSDARSAIRIPIHDGPGSVVNGEYEEKAWKAAEAKCPKDCSLKAWHECKCTCKALEDHVSGHWAIPAPYYLWISCRSKRQMP